MRVSSNVGPVDRVLRFLFGLGVLGVGLYGPLVGGAATAAILIALVLIVTSMIGYCPLYRVLGVSTAGRDQGPSLDRG